MHMRSITPKLTRKVALAGKGQFSASPILHPLERGRYRRLLPKLLVSSLERSRLAADASREVVERWLLDGFDVSVGHRRCSRDPSTQNDAGGTPGSKISAPVLGWVEVWADRSDSRGVGGPGSSSKCGVASIVW